MNSTQSAGTHVPFPNPTAGAHPFQISRRVNIAPVPITKESTRKPLHIKSQRRDRVQPRQLRPAVGVSSPTIERSLVVNGVQVISKAYEDPRRRLSLPNPLISSKPQVHKKADNGPLRDFSTSVDETQHERHINSERRTDKPRGGA
jgi:hypothetical protein